MKPILEYIPHRPPFVMVDKLISCDIENTHTQFTIKEDNLFVENGYFTDMGILENIAQTCAARLGYLNCDQPIKIGVIGAVDNFEVYNLPEIGDSINTRIFVNTEFFNVIIISAKVINNENIIASCNMKVVLTDIDSQA